MQQIADAPWIREAEMYGYPPYEEEPFPADSINDSIGMADDSIGKALDYLEDALKKVDGSPYFEDLIKNLISTLDDYRDDIGEAMGKVEKGDW